MQYLNEIAASQIHTVIGRMPKIELSYETNSHKKDDLSYKIGLAIPTGKKYYAWITYNEDGDDVIYMMEINREHKIARIFWQLREPTETPFEIGTIFYGTMAEGLGECKTPVYLIEDILYDRGISTKYFLFPQRMTTIYKFLREHRLDGRIHIALPILWPRNDRDDGYKRNDGNDSDHVHKRNDGNDRDHVHKRNDGNNKGNITIGQLEEFGTIPDKWSNKIGYTVHHIQYRCPDKIAPFVNVFFNKPSINIEGNLVTCFKQEIREHKGLSYKCKYRHDFNKPQYKTPTIFLVKADLDADIYRLFAYGRNKMREYYGIAYIASYESSVFMNRLFRHIKENENLDFIEESDDEEEFENVDPERFVNLEKELMIECIFSQKFKKWVPKKVVPGGNIVHIGQLCRDL